MRERGSVLPLVAGLFALCGVFAVAVIDSTNLAITRSQLQSVADGAALAAAQSVTPSTGALVDGALVVTLTNGTVSRVARRFIADSAISGIRVRAANTPDGRTALVTLAQTWRAPLDSDFLPVRIRLTATARARTAFG